MSVTVPAGRQRTEHELNAIEVRGTPVVPVDEKGQSLFTLGRVHHDGASAADQLDDARPQQVTYSCWHVPDEHTG